MKDKTIVITGATSGIGEAAALALARMGARIVGVARDKSRGAKTLKKLKRTGADHQMHYADLSRLSEMKRIAAEIRNAEPRIDVLINNAGTAAAVRRETEDEFETTFATNHLAYFVLTLGLREKLLQSAPSRIINTASMTYAWAKLDLNDLQSKKSFDGTDVYAKSKLCNVLFTLELSRRLAETGVTANCLHPGFVNTRLGSQDGGLSGVFGISTSGALRPEEGCQTTVYLASSPEVAKVSGKYFNRSAPETLSKVTQDATLAARLWEESERLTGMTW